MSLRAASPLSLVCLSLLAACAPAGPARDEGLPREAFPPGPYGTTEGERVQNLRFTLPDGAPLELQELRQDESAELLLLATAAGWCTACVEEQPALERLFEEREAEGLRVVVAVFEDREFAPAGPDDAARWRDENDVRFPVVADPDFQLRDYYDSTLTPMNMLVHLGSMEIERVTTGWDPGLMESLVEALL